MDSELMKDFYEDIQTGGFEEAIAFTEQMLNDEKFIFSFLFKLHYGPQKSYDHCGKPGSVHIRPRSGLKKESFILRCTKCGDTVSLISNTVLRNSKNRLGKITHSIHSENKTKKNFMKNGDMKVRESTAIGMLKDLKIQGVHPETNPMISKMREDMIQTKTAWISMCEILIGKEDLALEKSWKVSLEQIDKYIAGKIFMTQCEQFFKKIEKKSNSFVSHIDE